jgi:hypothetical protein
MRGDRDGFGVGLSFICKVTTSEEVPENSSHKSRPISSEGVEMLLFLESAQ